MNNEQERVFLLISIVKRGSAAKLMEKLDNEDIRMHFHSVGFGTAPTEMMDIFGLGSNDKDIVYSMATESIVSRFAANFGNVFTSYSEFGGFLMILKLSAINRLAVQILKLGEKQNEYDEVYEKMSNEHKQNLIIITVSQGYVDSVMAVAKKAGATGGTVVRGRFAETEKLEEIVSVPIEKEREMIFIMAPSNISEKIMDDVNKEFGFTTEARGIMCMVPIEKAFKI